MTRVEPLAVGINCDLKGEQLDLHLRKPPAINAFPFVLIIPRGALDEQAPRWLDRCTNVICCYKEYLLALPISDPVEPKYTHNLAALQLDGSSTPRIVLHHCPNQTQVTAQRTRAAGISESNAAAHFRVGQVFVLPGSFPYGWITRCPLGLSKFDRDIVKMLAAQQSQQQASRGTRGESNSPLELERHALDSPYCLWKGNGTWVDPDEDVDWVVRTVGLSKGKMPMEAHR